MGEKHLRDNCGRAIPPKTYTLVHHLKHGGWCTLELEGETWLYNPTQQIHTGTS